MIAIATLMDNYRDWLRDRTAIKQLADDWTEITTPFVDRHNDYIQIYVRPDKGGVLLTDDGYTLTDLEQSGCALNTPKRQALLEATLNGFGVRLDHGALTISATTENFPLKKHNLVQAVLAVNDLFYLASSTVRSLFLEDVTNWLDLSDIRYIPNTRLPGESGFDHAFDFAIPRSRHAPERLLRAVNNPTRDKAESFAFGWHDTRNVRPAGAQAYAIMNDNERPVPGNVRDALTAYGINLVPWSRREEARAGLAA